MEEKFLQAEEPEAGKSSRFQTRRNLNSSSGFDFRERSEVTFLKMKNTFGKEEKLKSRKIIEQLFKEGKSVKSSGFTLVYLEQSPSTFYPVQAGFSVPKKHFKKAVDRNRVKRLMREVYRNSKNLLYEKLAVAKRQVVIMFVYNGKELPDYRNVSAAVNNCLNKMTGI
jgi:ribonuclease P protein component